MWLRYVLVPGWSDQEEYLHQLEKHFSNYKSIQKVEILPYHQLGVHKWEVLGMENKHKGVEPPDHETLERTANILSRYFKDVQIN